MPRPAGSYGVLRREFESELMRFCDETQFSLGYACGVLLKKAFDESNEAAFTRLSMVADRYLPEAPREVGGQVELVIDRRREAIADQHAEEACSE